MLIVPKELAIERDDSMNNGLDKKQSLCRTKTSSVRFEHIDERVQTRFYLNNAAKTVKLGP